MLLEETKTSDHNRLSPYSKDNIKDLVSEQISIDLSTLLNNSGHPKKKLRIISERTQIHKKTLQRLLEKQNIPSYSTVFKIYSFITQANTTQEVIEKSPPVISNYLKQSNKEFIGENFTVRPEDCDKIMENPVLLDLFAFSTTGDVPTELIKDKFGEYGLTQAEYLVQLGIFVKSAQDKYKMNTQSQLFPSPKLLIKLGLNSVINHTDPTDADTRDKMHIYFLSKGLSDEGYRQWRKIDEESFNKKIELMNNPQFCGSKRAFTFSIVDTLKRNKNE